MASRAIVLNLCCNAAPVHSIIVPIFRRMTVQYLDTSTYLKPLWFLALAAGGGETLRAPVVYCDIDELLLRDNYTGLIRIQEATETATLEFLYQRRDEE